MVRPSPPSASLLDVLGFFRYHPCAGPGGDAGQGTEYPEPHSGVASLSRWKMLLKDTCTVFFFLPRNAGFDWKKHICGPHTQCRLKTIQNTQVCTLLVHQPWTKTGRKKKELGKATPAFHPEHPEHIVNKSLLFTWLMAATINRYFCLMAPARSYSSTRWVSEERMCIIPRALSADYWRSTPTVLSVSIRCRGFWRLAPSLILLAPQTRINCKSIKQSTTDQ